MKLLRFQNRLPFFMMNKNIPYLISVFLIVPWLLLSCSGSSPLHHVEQNMGSHENQLQQYLPHVTAVEFKKIKDNGEKFILLDVREKEEYIAAHLPGSINISLLSLEQEVPNKIQDTDTTIYVYCMIGIRSAIAAQKLTELGYTNVINIIDSFKGWTEAGYPVYNQLGEFVMTPGGYEKKE